MKETKIVLVKIDQIRFDKTFQSVWKNAISSAFFAKAVEKFKHYTYPIAYVKNGFYYLLGQKPSLDAAIKLGQDEILIEVIDIEETQVTQFLIAFLSKEHKELRCTAELLRMILQYTKSPEGTEWFKTVCDSRDKEVRLAVILGLSIPSIKMYLHLLQPGKERFLALLDDTQNYSLSKAYKESLAAEKEMKQSDDASEDADDADKDEVLDSEQSKSAAHSAPDDTAEPQSSKPERQPANHADRGARVQSETENAQGPNEDDFMEHLEKYKKPTPGNEQEDQKFALKVVVLLRNGSQLEVSGKIRLYVNGGVISSTEQLHDRGDGVWELSDRHSSFSLSVESEGDTNSNGDVDSDDFFIDF